MGILCGRKIVKRSRSDLKLFQICKFVTLLRQRVHDVRPDRLWSLGRVWEQADNHGTPETRSGVEVKPKNDGFDGISDSGCNMPLLIT